MEASFDPHAIEAAIYRRWEEAGHFAPKPDGEGYCIVIPPPNVTGSLHMGHAFQHTLMDALIRYRRMQGRAALWQMGTDHAGISTQMLVERQLNAEGKTRHELGRDRFIDRVWQWKAESGGNISQQLRRMGSSLDWSRERFTLDAGFSRAVIEVFVRLHEEGLIYRGQRLVNWDPALRTAISDLEVINTEEQGSLWHFRYPLCDGARTADGKDHLVVATTRPETMLGDTAVAVHPSDERFRALIGQRARLPLVDRELPIIADEYGGSGLWFRLRQDHSRPRLQRLRSGVAARLGYGQRAHRRGSHQRQCTGCLPGLGPLCGPAAHRCGPGRLGPA